MPSAKSHSTVSRQWELLKHLPKCESGITVTELLARLDSSGFKISRVVEQPAELRTQI